MIDLLIGDTKFSKNIRLKYGLDGLYQSYKKAHKKDKLALFVAFIEAANKVAETEEFIEDYRLQQKESVCKTWMSNNQPLLFFDILGQKEEEYQKEEHGYILLKDDYFLKPNRPLIYGFKDGEVCWFPCVYSEESEHNLSKIPVISLGKKEITVSLNVPKIAPVPFRGDFGGDGSYKYIVIRNYYNFITIYHAGDGKWFRKQTCENS